MLNIDAKEFIPTKYNNTYINDFNNINNFNNFKIIDKDWDNNEKILFNKFKINEEFILEDNEWINIECEIHLINLDQNYENLIDNINKYFKNLIEYDTNTYNGVNTQKIIHSYFLKIKEEYNFHILNKLNIIKKYNF